MRMRFLKRCVFSETARPRAIPAAVGIAVGVALAAVAGCQWAVDDSDREVYRLVEGRQRDAISRTSDARIDQQHWPAWEKPYAGGYDRKYDFVPHPVDNEVPESFRRAASQPADTRPSGLATTTQLADVTPAATQPVAATSGPSASEQVSASQPATVASAQSQPASRQGQAFTLSDALGYAFRHARDFQSAKEDLYLAALALSLERHMWTPRLMGDIRTRYANYGEIRNFDHAMDVVAQTAVEQKLPYGGEVTAKVINSLMRDLTHHLTSGETGQAVLEANIPLLRGAGPAAYESRYQAERNLIYAVRTFERFRQTFAVSVARDYFELQRLKQEIVNVTDSIRSFAVMVDLARARWLTGRVLELEVQRAEQDRLDASNRRLVAIEAYRSGFEEFKVRLGMPADADVDVEWLGDPAGELTAGSADLRPTTLQSAIHMPAVSEDEAGRVGLKYRLDLLNVLDRIGDRRRGVAIAENNLLPALDATGSVTWDTNPSTLGMLRYEHERATWRSTLDLDLPLDRKAERNALRSALIDKQRAERGYEQARDLVDVQVRQAMRSVLLQQASLRIQLLSRDLADQRRKCADNRFEQGRVSNREVVDAENALLRARNALAQAQIQYRRAVLEFLRDTGMLRLDDEGQWADLVAGQGG